MFEAGKPTVTSSRAITASLFGTGDFVAVSAHYNGTAPPPTRRARVELVLYGDDETGSIQGNPAELLDAGQAGSGASRSPPIRNWSISAQDRKTLWQLFDQLNAAFDTRARKMLANIPRR